MLRSGPNGLNSEERAHFGATISERLSQRGAIGTIMFIMPEDTAQFPYEQIKGYFRANFMNWTGPDGTAFTKSPGIRAGTILSPEMSKALFKGQPVSWEDVTKYKAGKLKTLPSFDMGPSYATGKCEPFSDIATYTLPDG